MTWVAAVAAAALTACAAAPEESTTFGTDMAEPEQQAPEEEAQGAELDDPAEDVRGADPTRTGDDGETPWHLLPDADRPAPVVQPQCAHASPTPVAC